MDVDTDLLLRARIICLLASFLVAFGWGWSGPTMCSPNSLLTSDWCLGSMVQRLAGTLMLPASGTGYRTLAEAALWETASIVCKMTHRPAVSTSGLHRGGAKAFAGRRSSV